MSTTSGFIWHGREPGPGDDSSTRHAGTDPAGDREALERMALWGLKRYSPIVAVDGSDGIVMESIGAHHLHGGEERMLAQLAERFAASGTSARGRWGRTLVYLYTARASSPASHVDLPVPAFILSGAPTKPLFVKLAKIAISVIGGRAKTEDHPVLAVAGALNGQVQTDSISLFRRSR